jgi:hypothetical protein
MPVAAMARARATVTSRLRVRGVVVGRGIEWYWVILRGFEADLGCSSFGWW